MSVSGREAEAVRSLAAYFPFSPAAQQPSLWEDPFQSNQSSPAQLKRNFCVLGSRRLLFVFLLPVVVIAAAAAAAIPTYLPYQPTNKSSPKLCPISVCESCVISFDPLFPTRLCRHSSESSHTSRPPKGSVSALYLAYSFRLQPTYCVLRLAACDLRTALGRTRPPCDLCVTSRPENAALGLPLSILTAPSSSVF